MRLITVGAVAALFVVAAPASFGGHCLHGQTNSPDPVLTAQVTQTLQRYAAAVRTANTDSLRVLWADTTDVAFITPLQRLKTWAEVQAFWDGFVRTTYKERELRFSNLTVTALGDLAWASFDIEFQGVLADGTPVGFRGWETQVYRRVGSQWLLAYIHYSIPITQNSGGTTAS